MHCRRILYQLSYQGSPMFMYLVAEKLLRGRWESGMAGEGHPSTSRLLGEDRVRCPKAHSLDDLLSNSKKYRFPTGRSLLTFQDLALKLGLYHPLPELPRWLTGKESACSAVDPGLIPELGRFPGGSYGYPLWYSCLENPMDRRA